jgi:ubiquinone/menaquinone biosynthesis C-methylase UbiE
MALSRAMKHCIRPAFAAAARMPSQMAAHSSAWASAPVAPVASRVRRFSTRESWSQTDDVDLDSVAYGFMASQALFSALEIGVFEHIGSAGPNGTTVEELKKLCGIDSPRLQTLLTALVSVKCLRRSPEGIYTLSPNTAQYMLSTSKQFYGDYLRYQIGRQFYQRMGALPEVMTTGKAPNYASWFSDPEVAQTYTEAQHNGSTATAKYLVKKKLQLGGISTMLDVGGGSGAFSYVFARETPGLKATVLELPEVCRSGDVIRAKQPKDIQDRVNFVEMDATNPKWPVADEAFDIVLMSYISGSVPEASIVELYSNAMQALKPGGRLLVHDFMVNDTLDGPCLGALWGLQHVTVNASGLGLCPSKIIERMGKAGFDTKTCETLEMIHSMTKLIVAHKD